MRSVAAAALVLLLAAACSTTGPSPNELNLPPGPASDFPPPQQPATDPRVGELQTAMTELLERLDVMNDRLAKLEASQADMMSNSERPSVPAPAPSAAAPSSPVASAPAASAPVRTSSVPARADIYNQYRNALVLFGKNRFGDARAVFQQVFDAEPAGELADNALYWIGETYYTAGDYQNALRFYSRVTKDFASENKAPDAMFKIGLTYARTGDLAMARKTLEETIRKYPYATAAGTAKAELSRIRY